MKLTNNCMQNPEKGVNQQTEIAMSAEKISKDLIMYKRKLDEVKSKTASKKEHLRQLQDKYNEVAKDQNGGNVNQSGSGMLDDDHPQMRTIRVMENRLDKAMIKYNEAMSIKKAYELIVKRLREERIGYDNQLSAIEQSLKGKESDFQELIILSQDASYAKDQAEKELNSYELQLSKMNAEQAKQQQKVMGNRLFANSDDSINVVNIPGITGGNTHSNTLDQSSIALAP